MSIACSSKEESIQYLKSEGRKVVRLYSTARDTGACLGSSILKDIQRAELKISPQAWELLTFALSVTAADCLILRRNSPDGWSREIDLLVEVSDEEKWNKASPLLEKMLAFLSGDIWKLSFIEGLEIPSGDYIFQHDCVSLFSGGLDSFIGALDLEVNNHSPLLVSHSNHYDHSRQIELANLFSDNIGFQQFSHNLRAEWNRENSSRTRSFLFLSYAVLLSTALESYGSNATKCYIPENGFISLNVPLTNLRIGSLSTRTTHPDFLNDFSALLEELGLQVIIENPYQFCTKSEMIESCLNQDLLKEYLKITNSCGRAQRIHSHCGRCVPCIIRRSAIYCANLQDRTPYLYKRLLLHRSFDDVFSMCMAIVKAKERSIGAWIGPSFPISDIENNDKYTDVIRRGLDELESFLRSQKLL